MAQEGMSRATIIICCVSIACISLGATIGLVLHYTMPREIAPEAGPRADAVVNCIPQGEQTKATCDARGCFWREPTDGAPWCTFPVGYGYVMDGPITVMPLGYRARLRLSESRVDLYSPNLQNIILDVEMQTDSRIRIKFYEETVSRYEVPKEAINIPSPETAPDNATRLYDVIFQEEPHFGIMVVRRSTNIAVFNATLPGMTFSEQYLQLGVRLPSSHLYGLGEHNHKRFKHDMNWRNWTIFTRDVAPIDDWNLYGAQPMYLNLEEDGNAHGVFLLNSNAMDIALQPDPFPAVTYHVIGGVLDYYVLLGPGPEQVVQQYTQATGRPFMPPYWALGFQLSRWGYKNLTEVQMVVDRNRDAGIPQDVQYGDIDHMESKLDFTYDRTRYAGLPGFIDELHARGQRYVIILDHAIGSNETILNATYGGTYPPYNDGIQQDIFIHDPRSPAQYLKGEVWPGETVYPDFTDNRTHAWWLEQCQRFYDADNVKYDALWIDMNEPSNFVPGSTTGCADNNLNHPPYLPNILGSLMYDKTICMDAEQKWGTHFDVHSLYGHSMSIATWRALRDMFPDDRPLVISRSTFAGSQSYTGHWLGDNHSEWPNLHWSIIGMMEFSLFGFSYTGADICGFWYAATEEMCIRWMQLGAFYPFARNHNADTWPDQDPAAFGEPMTRISRDILMTRYRLLPYLYTLMHEAHAYGSTVVRPMMHEFTSDRQTWSIDRQFMWGAGFLITPVLEQGAVVVEGYFPSARWYDYYDGKEMELVGIRKNISTPLDKINLHVRGGHIIPWQIPDNTTYFSRQNDMGLTVALGSAPNYEARGSLYWDDGISYDTQGSGKYLMVDFTSQNYRLDIVVVHDGFMTSLIFETIDLWGLSRDPVWIKLNGTDLTMWSFDPYTKAVQISGLDLSINDNHHIEWNLS